MRQRPVRATARAAARWAARKELFMATSPGEAWKPYERGYHAVYREHEVNHCPGCGRTHWLIGRMSAECAFCATALPLAEASMRSHNGPVIIQHKNRDLHDWAA
jgi:hypothetical protein